MEYTYTAPSKCHESINPHGELTHGVQYVVPGRSIEVVLKRSRDRQQYAYEYFREQAKVVVEA